MKKLNKFAIAAEELMNLRSRRKALDEAEKTIKESLLAALGDETAAEAGKYLIMQSDRTRTDLDKKALEVELGEELRRFEKQTTYTILEVKVMK